MARIHFSDVEVPKASIQKIIKDAAEGRFVQKDAKLAFSKATTVFVSYLAAVASETAKKNGQKTLTAGNIEAALESIGFGEWEEELLARQTRYAAQQVAGGRRPASADADDGVVDGRVVEDNDLIRDDIDETQPMDTD